MRCLPATAAGRSPSASRMPPAAADPCVRPPDSRSRTTTAAPPPTTSTATTATAAQETRRRARPPPKARGPSSAAFTRCRRRESERRRRAVPSGPSSSATTGPLSRASSAKNSSTGARHCLTHPHPTRHPREQTNLTATPADRRLRRPRRPGPNALPRPASAPDDPQGAGPANRPSADSVESGGLTATTRSGKNRAVGRPRTCIMQSCPKCPVGWNPRGEAGRSNRLSRRSLQARGAPRTIPSRPLPAGETGSAASVGAQRRGAAQRHGKRDAATLPAAGAGANVVARTAPRERTDDEVAIGVHDRIRGDRQEPRSASASVSVAAYVPLR